MIEKYFRQGIRYKWVAPLPILQSRDGRIADNTGVISPMIYDGVDRELIHDSSLGNVTTHGFKMGMPINHVWLDYNLGRTSICPLNGADVLTGFMSGCYIAQWTYGKVRYAAHVGTVDDSATVNTAVKGVFARAIAGDLTACGFNPALAWSPDEIRRKLEVFRKAPIPRIVALVTTAGEFYSILMLQLRPEQVGGPEGMNWCVGGIKKVQGIDQKKLIEELNKTGK